MNQPIQENKERCQNCGMRIEDFRENGQFYCDEEGKQRHDFPPQNTSREEIRERWKNSDRFTYLANLIDYSPGTVDSVDLLSVADWWLNEIEASEKRGYEDGRLSTTFYSKSLPRLELEDQIKVSFLAGQKAERERVQEELEGLRQERDELRDELYKIHH